MKSILILFLLAGLTACSHKTEPTTTKTEAPEAAATEKIADNARQLPELNPEDIRVNVKDGDAVVDFHCDANEESGTITATRVDTVPPKALFKVEAEFGRLAMVIWHAQWLLLCLGLGCCRQ